MKRSWIAAGRKSSSSALKNRGRRLAEACWMLATCTVPSKYAQYDAKSRAGKCRTRDHEIIALRGTEFAQLTTSLVVILRNGSGTMCRVHAVSLMCLSVVLTVGSQRTSLAGDPHAAVPKLESLSGTMIVRISEDAGITSKIWCKGDNCRTEMKFGETTLVTIQRGNALYTYGQDRSRFPAGQVTAAKKGLASMSLNRQIERVLTDGKSVGSETLRDGKAYSVYEYKSEQGRAIAYLSPETLLPKLWISVVNTPAGGEDIRYITYRDMTANIEIADDVFELPSDIVFEELKSPR